jgi:hypothetical protein
MEHTGTGVGRAPLAMSCFSRGIYAQLKHHLALQVLNFVRCGRWCGRSCWRRLTRKQQYRLNKHRTILPQESVRRTSLRWYARVLSNDKERLSWLQACTGLAIHACRRLDSRTGGL